MALVQVSHVQAFLDVDTAAARVYGSALYFVEVSTASSSYSVSPEDERAKVNLGLHCSGTNNLRVVSCRKAGGGQVEFTLEELQPFSTDGNVDITSIVPPGKTGATRSAITSIT